MAPRADKTHKQEPVTHSASYEPIREFSTDKESHKKEAPHTNTHSVNSNCPRTQSFYCQLSQRQFIQYMNKTPSKPTKQNKTPKAPKKQKKQPNFHYNTRQAAPIMDAVLQAIQQLTAHNDRTQTLVKRNTTTRPFFTEKSMSFKSFIRQLNDFLNANEMDHAEALRILPSLLSDSARDAYESLDRNLRTNGPWDNLLEALQTAIYTPEKKLWAARTTLNAIRQGTQTVEQLGKQCIELANKAYPTTAEANARNAYLFSCFLNGLETTLRNQVRRSRPDTFEAAKTAAIHEETILALEKYDKDNDVKTAIN